MYNSFKLLKQETEEIFPQDNGILKHGNMFPIIWKIKKYAKLRKVYFNCKDLYL